MAVPEDVGRDLPSGELLPGRNLLDPGLFCQAVYGPENSLGAQVSGASAWEEPHLARLDALLDSLQSALAYTGARRAAALICPDGRRQAGLDPAGR